MELSRCIEVVPLPEAPPLLVLVPWLLVLLCVNAFPVCDSSEVCSNTHRTESEFESDSKSAPELYPHCTACIHTIPVGGRGTGGMALDSYLDPVRVPLPDILKRFFFVFAPVAMVAIDNIVTYY